jgi:Holliday junction resolvasome RuvABC endonuclease subunit
MPINVMAMDPGFSNFGVAIIEVGPDYDKVIHVDVIRTQRSNKKLKVLASTDDDRRAREIAKELWDLNNAFQPSIFTCEERPNVRSASASAKVAISWAIPVTIAAFYNLPLLQQSPQNIKLRATGIKTSTKREIMTAMEKIFPGQFEKFKKKYPPQKDGQPAGVWEHGYDAVASYWASRDEQVLQIARSMVR